MRDYNYLDGLQNGTDDFSLQVSLKGYAPPSGGSGHVDPGVYGLVVKSVTVQDKKEKSGKNIVLRAEISEPAAFRGVPIVKYIPRPVDGSPTDTGYTMLQQFAWSLGTARGNLPQMAAAESVTLNGKTLAGNTFYAEIRDGRGGFSGRSEIGRFISKEEFSASPGPAMGMSHEAVPQNVTPEVATANNNGRRNMIQELVGSGGVSF